MDSDPQVEWYLKYTLPHKRPPLQEWTEKSSAPPESYSAQFEAWRAENPGNRPTRHYDGFNGFTYPGAPAPRNPDLSKGRGR